MASRRLLALLCGLGFALVALAFPSAVLADDGCDRYVLGVDTSDANDCSDETAPCRTVQFAIDQAVDGDTICIADHPLAGPLVYTGTLVITKSVVLDGAWEGMCVDPSGLNCQVYPVACDPANVTLDAEGAGRVVTIDGSAAPGTLTPAIQCLTITGGDADGLGGDPGGSNAGGGVFSVDASPIIANTVITGNYGCDTCSTNPGCGGGIYLLNATATAVVRDSVIAYNVADNSAWGRGGGVMLRDSDALIVDNVIDHNRAGLSAGDGGGVAVFDGSPVLRGNEILGNVAGWALQGQGGGVYVWSDASITLSGNVVRHNTAITGAGDPMMVSSGGGFHIAGNPAVRVDISGNTLSDNVASPLGPQLAQGGGIYLRNVVSPSLVMSNSVVSNIAGHNDDGLGGGVHIEDSTLQLTGNVIADNVATWSGGEGRGGGVHIAGGSVDVRDNTVVDNYGAYFPGLPSTAVGYGGGISLAHSESRIRGNLIGGNVATRAANWGLGGGIYGEGGTLEIGDNVIRENVATHHLSGFGGGVALTETTALVWGNSVISNTATITKAGAGGGIYGGYGTYEVVGNLIQGNIASPVSIGSGGGVHFQFDTVTLEGNTILDNVATPGGMLSVGGGVRLAIVDAFTMTNNIVARNGPAQDGAGVAILDAKMGELVHNTIAENVEGDAVGVYIKGESAVELTNNIVTVHKVGILNDSPGIASVAARYSLYDSNGTDTVGVTGSYTVAGPAGLLPNYHLGPTSNAIDNAPTLPSVSQDIDREPRPTGKASDVGADEFTCLARAGVVPVDYPSVQQAIDASALSATVKVAGGTCYENVSIGKTVTVEGGWRRDFVVRLSHPATLSTIDGMGTGRVISMSAPTGQTIEPVVDGLTLRGGDASGLGGSSSPVYTADIGGGIYGYRADATVRDCIVEDNVASTDGIGWGGGMGFYLSSVTLEGNTVAGNVASETSNGYGGGIALRFGQSSLDGNTVRTNTAAGSSGIGHGGGVWIAQATVGLTDNTVGGNAASTEGTGYGGGVHGLVAQLTLSGDEFVGNAASGGSVGYGGGVSTDMGQLSLDHVTLQGNDAVSFGGGLYVKESTSLAVASSHLISNTAGMGGGFYVTAVPSPLISGNVISANVGGYAGGGDVVGGSDLVFEDNQVFGNHSDGLAGGLWVSGSDGAHVQRNWFVGNAAEGAGGGLILMDADDVRLVNNIVGGNAVGEHGKGAGLYVEGSAAELVHTTLAQNTGGDGSGVHVGPQATVQMTNTIVVSHTVGVTVTVGSSATTMTTLWGEGEWANLANTGGAGTVVTSPTNVVGYPWFVDPDMGDYRITGGAAVDAAVYAGVDDDVDGHARPIGEGYDIGAHEAWLRVFMPLVLKGF